MKYQLMPLVIFGALTAANDAPAWDGFDADSTDLVEIIPNKIPAIGDSVDVRNYEQDTTQICVVQSIKRNRRTIEVTVMCEGHPRTLVMESK